MYHYKTAGTCSRKINFELEEGKVKKVRFEGGCSGNLQGLCKLVEGRDAKEVAKMLAGIHCGDKSTSCPDQLAEALKQALEK